jgi:hypothetical protein
MLSMVMPSMRALSAPDNTCTPWVKVCRVMFLMVTPSAFTAKPYAMD